MGRITTAVNWGNGKAYFFFGAKYLRYDIAGRDADAGFPQPIAGSWPGLWERDLNAAVNWGDGKAYFFKGSEYVRYDIAKDRVEEGWPKPIRNEWPGLWESDVHAAVNWSNGKVYFFKGAEYVRYDIGSDRVDEGWPKPIAKEWPGIWDRDIDAIVKLDDRSALFFRGQEYISYDIASDRAESGFPRPIPPSWCGEASGSTTDGDSTDGEEALRERIVDLAAAELTDQVHAKTFGGTDASGRPTRRGWEQLIEYFHIAAPSVWSDDAVKYDNTVGGKSIPHWCGIFALWALKSAGCSVGNWRIGIGISQVQGIHSVPASRVKPGDVGFIAKPFQHHFIVERVNGDGSVDTIDGNSGTDSEVRRNHRARGSVDSFWTAF